MNLVGIDPGLNLTGYACVELVETDPEPRLLEAGVIRLQKGEPMPARLAHLFEDLDAILAEFTPSRVVVESIFSHRSFQKAGLLMGHARGVVLLAAERRGIPTAELAPAEVKRALTGNGRATKRQIQEAVMAQCGLAEPPSPPDVADAIAIAFCAARRAHQTIL
ncbi:MAG: hypothetical protein CBC35_05580 [Planctomycetes bacterium TMED75]|nr:MAG: hypothetical protein CBC35_05580 [Planctomycetes bacterium TMED75]